MKYDFWKSKIFFSECLEKQFYHQYEIYADFDIIFIQEPSWNSICFVPSNYNDKGESLMEIVNHPN